MRIADITIKNYRQYQSLFFTFPKSRSYDLHIIVAQNGVGKTNLLNAITWCLYGTEPHLGDETKDAGLPKLNLKAMEEAREMGKDTEYVEVTIRSQDQDEYITYNRCLPFRITPEIFEEIAKEKFTVTVTTSSGDTKVYESQEDTSRIVRKYMPENIREYFYFDGEQLNNYFISERKSKVRDAIFTISQVDVVNQVYNRLGIIIGDKQREAASKAPDIKKIKDELDENEKLIASLEEKVRKIDEQIEKSERIIKENTEFLRGEENLPELEERHQELSATLDNLRNEHKELMTNLFSFVREMKTTLTLYPAARKALDIIMKKEGENALPPNIDKALLLKALEEHTCTICNQSLSKHSKGRIQQLIDSFQVSSATSHLLLSIRSELERIINDTKSYPRKKNSLITHYKRIKNQIEESETQLDDIDKRINRISDKDEVKRRHNERNEHKELLKRNSEFLGVAKKQLKDAQEQKEKLSLDLEKALAKDAECSRIRQLIEFATKARNVISAIEEEMMNEVRIKMESKDWHQRSGLPLKRFFNTSGQLYRELQLKEKLSRMTEEEQYKLLKNISSVEEDTFTQFGYACKQLGIQIKTSSVPQAKGRVERMFQTLQSRLPLELRLAGVTSIEQANEFLKAYIKEFNAQFALPVNNTKLRL